MRFKLQRVHYMPKELKPGVLYVSEEFDAAAHLCACGCGSKVRTPLGPTEWRVEERPGGPSLYPSVGNWQLACRSHYWIKGGRVVWAETWSSQQVEEGRRDERLRRQAYFDQLDRNQKGFLRTCWNWIKSKLSR
jgi:hypothetical protein